MAMGNLRRLVYGLIGFAGLETILGMFGFSLLGQVGLQDTLSIFVSWALAIAGVNWGVVALTGKEDLLEMLNVK